MKFQLGCKADGAHHPERIITESALWLHGCADELLLQIVNSAKGIYQLTKVLQVQTDSKGIDGEVSSFLIIFYGSRFHFRIA